MSSALWYIDIKLFPALQLSPLHLYLHVAHFTTSQDPRKKIKEREKK
jgi:hypothetical protein